MELAKKAIFVLTFSEGISIGVRAFRGGERRGVRHGASRRMRFRNPLDFKWISDFRMDFWISKWISGFQSGFLEGFLDFKRISGFQSEFLDFKVDFSRDFWISSEFLDFKADVWISFEPLLF